MTMLKRVSIAFCLLLFAASPVHASWSFGPVQLGNIALDGTFAGRIPLENEARQDAYIAPFLTHRIVAGPGPGHSAVIVEGLKTFLSITGDRQAVWRSPCGVEVRQKINDFDSTAPQALARIYFSAGGNGLVLTQDGWRFMYVHGALVRMISPNNVLYRCRTRGPWIEEISVPAASHPIVLLKAEYADDGRVNSVTVGDTNYTLVYGAGDVLGRVYRNGKQWLSLGYENQLLSQIGGAPDYAGELKWKRVPGYHFLTKMINPTGYFLTAFRNEAYDFEMTQSTITLSRVQNGRKNTLHYNLYTESVAYE